MSVDSRVPEQGFVTVTPEELRGSNVLVVVLNGPFRVGHVSQVFTVVGVFLFDLTDGDGGQEDGGDGDEVGQFLPQLGDGFGVFDLVVDVFNPLLPGLGVDLVRGEGRAVDQLRSTKRVVRVESSRG